MNQPQADILPISVEELALEIRRIMNIESGGIPLHVPVFGANAEPYVSECVTTGWVSSVGKFVDRFEEDLAAFTGVKRAVAVVNGTAALHIALKLAGVAENDEVLLPAFTFVATANAIAYCHATPHFVDVEARTLGVDPVALREHLRETTRIEDGRCVNNETGRTIRVLIGMHTFGHPFDVDGILEVCREFNIVLVEDAAESIGSYYKGRHTGSFGRLGIVSFNGNKTITTGGGGAILTNDEALGDRARHLTTTGKVPHPYRYHHDEVAYNYRMPNLNAALGCSQLEDLPALIESKRSIAAAYLHTFANEQSFSIFSEPADCSSNYWLNAMVLAPAFAGLQEKIIEGLNAAGVHVRPVWEPLHKLPIFSGAPCASLPATEDLARRVINLPSTPVLAEKS